MRRIAGIAILTALVAAGCGSSGAREPSDDAAAATTVRVLAAASLSEAFGAIAGAYEAATDGVEVEVSFGGSPALVTQLAAGAPADVLATADEDSMARAAEAGDVREPAVFARNRLTVVVERGNPRGIRAVDDLARDDVLLVVCAPAVPCGRLTARVLDAAGVMARPRSQEENVKAVLSKVTLGEADAGLVYETDARAAGARVQARSILPADPGLTTSYPIAVTSEAAVPRAAASFVAFVRSDAGQRLLADHGFLPPA